MPIVLSLFYVDHLLILRGSEGDSDLVGPGRERARPVYRQRQAARGGDCQGL